MCSAGVDWNTSTSPRRRCTQTSEVEAVQYLSGDSCHISAYHQHTNVDTDCTVVVVVLCSIVCDVGNENVMRQVCKTAKALTFS